MEAPVNIELPAPMRAWVEAQARAGGYATISDYVCHVLEAEHRRSLRASVDEQLQAGLDSGPATPMTADDWQRIRLEGRQLAKSRRKPS